MKAQVIHKNLTSSNCVAILIDFQTRLLSTINSIDSNTLIENVFDLARMANSLGIPTILTTIGAKSFGGPLLTQLQMIFSNQEPIECSTMNVWEDRRVCKEVKRTGREKLLMAGLWTDFCVALSATQAVEAGYEIYVVTDACGDLSTNAQDTAVRRIIEAGAIPVACRQVIAELQQQKPLLHTRFSEKASAAKKQM